MVGGLTGRGVLKRLTASKGFRSASEGFRGLQGCIRDFLGRSGDFKGVSAGPRRFSRGLSWITFREFQGISVFECLRRF